MQENGGLFVSLLIAFVLVFASLGFAYGRNGEHHRIYDNCLARNSSMPYVELEKMCKDFVK